jgi:hypothetical protein
MPFACFLPDFHSHQLAAAALPAQATLFRITVTDLFIYHSGIL